MLDVYNGVSALKLELNENMVEDILNDTCDVVVNGHCMQENYMHTLIAANFNTSNKIVIHQIYNHLQIELQAEQYFSREIIENFRSSIKHKDLNSSYALLLNDKDNDELIVVSLDKNRFILLDIYDEIESYKKINVNYVEVSFLNRETLNFNTITQ